MMKALIYRARNRSLSWLAFGCALGLHLVAVGIAANKSPDSPIQNGPLDVGVVGVDVSPEPQAQPEDVPPNEMPLPSKEEEFISEEHPMPIVKRPRNPISVRSVTQSIGNANNGARLSSVRALVLYGPRPVYPYEARRNQITGSGVAMVRVDPLGNPIDVRMKESTGNPFLDKSTLETLRRWRFKPIAVGTIEVPITYTLTGASY